MSDITFALHMPSNFADHQTFSTRLCEMLRDRVIPLPLFIKINTRFHADTSTDYDIVTRVEAYTRWFVALEDAGVTGDLDTLREMAGMQSW